MQPTAHRIGLWLTFLLAPFFSYAEEKILGDVNGDGVINIQDFVTLVKHIQGVEYLSDTSKILQADANGDGLINSYDLEESMKYRFKRQDLPQLPKATILNTSPYNGEANVALSREFVVYFSMPISYDSNLSDIFSANVDFPVSAKLSGDGMKATLFLNGSRWPANSEISISLKIDTLRDKIGRTFAPNSISEIPSEFNWSFTTVATSSGDPSTSVSGYVIDSDNSDGEKPLEGVVVSVPGSEENLKAVTNQDGYFKISGVPTGRFFVNVDGRDVNVTGQDNSLTWQERSYYAFVGKAWEAILGKDNNATRYGSFDEYGRYVSDPRDGKIYLPLVKKGALQVVDPTKETEIKFVDGYLEEANSSLRAMMSATSLTIPPGSLISDNGTAGGSVGIAPVPANRLPEPLPPGLELPLVITIQTDGATNFDTPIPATFPNVDKLEPGAKSALWSFDHDKGKWEIAGPMTVSEDGLFVSTDPGVGIRQPGWHGAALGAQIFGRGGFCGSPAEELNEQAKQATLESIRAVEGELKEFAQYASGIEESIFLSDRKLIRQALNFTRNNGTINDWNDLKSTNGTLDSPANQTAYASGLIQLINNENTWIDLYGRADAIKKAAIHCANKKRIAGSQEMIQSRFNSFVEALDSAKLALRRQVSMYQSLANTADLIKNYLAGGTPQNVAQFEKDIYKYKRAIESLPAGWGGKRIDQQILQIIRNWHDFLNQGLTPYLTELTTNSFVYLKRIGSPAEELGPPPIASQRIRVGRGGSYDAIIRPNSVYEVWMLEPRRLQLGGTIFVSPPNGVNRRIANIPLAPDDLGDRDMDLLSDRAERVVGTDADNNDTDGDRLGDGFEVINGSDPNGGNPVFTGVIATAPTNHRGFSNRIIAENNLVFLGSQHEGIDCFEISGDADLPVWVSDYKRDETSVRNFSYSNDWLAVAEGQRGITLLDYSNPGVPKTLSHHTLESPVNAVSIAGGILFAGLENGAVLSMDALHGFVIDRLDYGSMIDDMTYLNGYLYFCHSNYPEVVKVEVNNGRFDHNNSVELRSWGWKPWRGGRRLFVGENFAYATNYNGFSYFNFDSNAYQTIRTPSTGWRRMVANGSGLALSVEGLTSFGRADSSLYTVDSNGTFLRGGGYLENFEATFRTLGDAQDISIYNGLAYVADGYEGLQVINYRAYEHQGGDPPQILSIHSNDQNGTVEESSLFTLSATVSDNVQVKYVEFWIDGNLTKTDGSYPFSIDYLAPRLADEQNFTTQIKVFDTGGNFSESNRTTWTISPDQTPPVLIDIFPSEGSIMLGGDTIMALFNEKLNPNDINESTVVFQEVSNPNSPILVPDCNVSYDNRLHAIFITLPNYLAPGEYELTLDANITDSLGNRLGVNKKQTFVGPSEIHGSIWFDSNHDRVWGGTEKELAGWTVFVDLDYNGKLSDGEPNATSDANGEYQLVNLLPGQYSVNEIIPYSWVQTFPKSNPVDEMAPTRGFEISGTLYQTSWPVQQNHVIDAMNQHFAISQSSNLLDDGYNQLILHKYAPNGILLKEIDVFEQNETTNTRISISSGLTNPILHLSTRNSNQSFETLNFEEKRLLKIEFKVGDIENNASYDITLAHLLDANLESTTEFGINEYSEHLHEHIITKVSPTGKLYVAGLLDGNLSIGGQLINETPDDTFSLLVARTDEFLDTEFVVTNSLVLPSPIPFYEGDHMLDFQFHENGKFLVSQSFGDSGTSYYFFAADGNLTESFLMPHGNNLDGLQKLDQHGFISGWQTYKDDSGNTLAILLDNNSSSAISYSPNWDMFKGAGFDYNFGTEEFWFYSAESNATPSNSDSFSVSVTGFDAFPSTSPHFAISPSGDSLWIWRSGLRRASYTPQILARADSSSDRQIYKIGALSDSYLSRFSKNWSYYNSWNVDINLEEIIDGSRSRMSSQYLFQYPTNDLQFLRALNRSFFSNSYWSRRWWDDRDQDFDILKDQVEEDLSVSFLANYSDTGRLRIGSVIDHNKHPNLGFKILQCKPAENNNGVWVLGVLSGEPTNEKVQLGGSAIDVSSLPKTVAIRIGGSTPDNHLVNLPENSVLADVSFGNALEKEEIKTLESFGGAQNDFSTDLVSDNLGNSFLAGSITNTIDFNQTQLNARATDGIVAKYAEDGKLEWQVILGGDGNDSINALTADGVGGVYATGSFEGNMTLSNGQTLHSSGKHDVYALHLDENASVIWAQSYGGFGNDAGTALHFHSAGGKDTLLLGGHFEQILAFGNRYLAAEGNGTNGFIAELNSTGGELINATTINTEGNATIQSILLDSSQRIVAGGDVSTSLTIWHFMGQPPEGETFHADFNGSLGDLNFSSGTPIYESDRAGFADRAIRMGTDDNLTWSAENNQSDFPSWTLTTWLKAESNDTVLQLGNDLEISIQWGEQDGNLSWGDSHHSVTTPLPVSSGTWIPLSVRQSGGGRHANTIAAGGSHSLLIKEDGSLWAMGSGNYKQVDTSSRDRICIEKIQSDDVAQVATSTNHSLFLKEDGSLWAMGYNNYGQLGTGHDDYYWYNTTSSSRSLTNIVTSVPVIQVATGERHSLFIKEDGSLWGMGSYYWGELGTGKDRTYFENDPERNARIISPIEILEEGVIQVAAGGKHSLFIKEDGSLWGMGINDEGQLGIGNTDGQKTPVQIRTSGVVQVTAGKNHSLFIDENGTLWGMGSSSSRQLGVDSNSTPQPIANGVLQVSAGDSHTLYIDSNGSLWGMGLNNQGQLGLGHSNNQDTPVQIRNSGVLQVSAGSNHSLFIDENESLWAMGYNNEGQLGTGNRSNYNSPVRVLEYGLRTENNLESSRAGISLYAADHFLGRLSSVHDPLFTIPLPLPAHDWPMDDNSTGTNLTLNTNRFNETNASLDLNNSSTLYLTDQNTSGGKTTTFWISPDNNSSITLAEHLYLDLNTTLANQWILQLKDDQNNSVSSDEINASSNNGWMQVSVSHRPDLATDFNRSLAGGSSHSLFIKEDGSLWGMGNDNRNQLGLSNYSYVYTPTQIEDVNLSQVAAGSEHSLFIKKDGSLWGMGYNYYGQLGNGSSSSSGTHLFEIRSSGIVQVVAGQQHSLFIDENGTLWGMGYYNNGQLGHGFDSSNGSYPYRQNSPTEIPAKLPVRRIAAGFSHSLFITADGSLWGMGDNSFGQLGTDSSPNQVCPTLIKHHNVSAIAAGASHSLFLEQNGSLYGMGMNTDGQLGDGSTTNQSTPVHIADNVLSIEAGHNHSLIMKKDGSLWMVGSNSNGQIGDGKSSQYAISEIDTFGDLNQTATGVNHTLFLQQGGTLFGRGINTYGQLGTGNSNAVTEANHVIDSGVREVAVGENHSLYVKNDGSLWTMGGNLEGQLGADSFGNLYTPTLIRNANVNKVVAGDFHSFFMEDNGSLWAMGRNYEGQLGDGTFRNQKKPVLIRESNVTKVAAGLHHSLFIDSNDTLWGMGDSYYGQLGQTSPSTGGTPIRIEENVTDIAAGDYHSLYIDSNGSLWGMGRNYDGQLGDQNVSTQYSAILIDTNVTSVFAGKNHSLFIKKNNTVWMMGRNTDGQLGNLDANNTSQLTPIQLSTSIAITSIVAGDNHTFFFDNAGSLYAAGRNEYGEFGIDSYDDPSTPVEVVKFGLKTDSPATDLGAKDHYSLFVDGIKQGSIVSDNNFTSSNFSMNFNGFTGGLDEIKIYQYYLTTAEHNGSYVRESAPPPHTYEFSPRNPPSSLASEDGPFLLDEMRLYPSSLAEEDLTHIFHYELPPLGRDYSTVNWSLSSSNSYLPPRQLPSIEPGYDASVSQGLFIASWEQDGILYSSKQIANGALSQIIAGNDNDFYAVGTFEGTLDWGDSLTNPNSLENSFFTHLESDLVPDWIANADSTTASFVSANDIYLDEDGYLHSTGSFAGELSLDGKSGTATGSNDLFYIKMDTFGQVAEIKTYGGQGNESGIGITADAQGGVVIAGDFDGNSSFFNSSGGAVFTQGDSDGFYLRYDYLAVIPKQEFEVRVAQNASGSNKYFIDGNESPDLTLIPGLSYQFHLDGNTTTGHPFYFGTSGTGGDVYQSEFLTGVQNSREEKGTVILSLDFDPQQPLFYLCGNHVNMGGEIKIQLDDRTRVPLTYGAIDGGGTNITGGNWTVTDQNGKFITSGQNVLVGTRVFLSYDPPSYYFFTKWDTNVTADKNNSNSIEFTVTEALEVEAIASTYSPHPLDLEGNFTLNLTDSNTTKALKFNINSSVTNTSATGQMEANIDQNQSGNLINYRGNFAYSTQTPSESTIVVTSYQMDQNGSWVTDMGGGYTMQLIFNQVSVPNHQGSYNIFYDDGSNESGSWQSSNIRKNP